MRTLQNIELVLLLRQANLIKYPTREDDDLVVTVTGLPMPEEYTLSELRQLSTILATPSF